MKMREKRGVLILTPFYEPNLGGVETHLKDLTEYLIKKEKYKVYVLTYQPNNTKAKGAYFEKRKNIIVIRIPWIGFSLFHKLEKYPLLEFLYVTPWLFVWTLVFLLFKSRDVDLIHAQGFNASFITRLMVKFYNKRFIVSTHAIYEMDQNSLMAKMVKWTLKRADMILALSDASKKELVKIGINENKIDRFTYWVNQSIFKPMNKENAKINIGLQKNFIVLYVGRFVDIKGIDILLDVAKIIREDLFFVYVGDGPLAITIREVSRKYSNVVLIGKVANHKLPVYYSAADILCVPSKYEEGFGRIIIEAISCGTPVIASNRGGIPEAIDTSVGMLVEPTTEDFYKAILYLFKNPEILESKRRLCRHYALKRFGSSNAEKILNSYINNE